MNRIISCNSMSTIMIQIFIKERVGFRICWIIFLLSVKYSNECGFPFRFWSQFFWSQYIFDRCFQGFDGQFPRNRGNWVRSSNRRLFCIYFFSPMFSLFLCVFPYRSRSKMVQEKNQTEKFVECVHLHRNLLWLTEKLKNLYSPIVFFQFFFSCLQICAITLELILVYRFYKYEKLRAYFSFHSIWCAFSMST